MYYSASPVGGVVLCRLVQTAWYGPWLGRLVNEPIEMGIEAAAGRFAEPAGPNSAAVVNRLRTKQPDAPMAMLRVVPVEEV